jgi:hypothetical protein
MFITLFRRVLGIAYFLGYCILCFKITFFIKEFFINNYLMFMEDEIFGICYVFVYIFLFLGARWVLNEGKNE